jgi:Ca2+-transporting ATPase
MEALFELTKQKANVLRESKIKTVESKNIVPGDIIELNAGDLVPADLRILKSSKLQANEAALTGESLPVDKTSDIIKESVPLAERENMLYKGTAITRGTAKGVTIFTGMDTELGKISKMVEESEIDELTPLEKRIKNLGRKLIWVLIIIIVIVSISSILLGKSFFLVIETSIALAVATLPEGLPIVATIVLARGMLRMAKKNALINKLSVVETLGSTNIICTDKTGTLTEGKMTVVKIDALNNIFEITGTGLDTEGEFLKNDSPVKIEKQEQLMKILRIGVLCNNANMDDGEFKGEPLEIALLIAGMKGGLNRKELLEEYPEVREVSFDPSINLMATFNKKNASYLVAVKGAPESVVEKCDRILIDNEIKEITAEFKRDILEKNKELAKQGLRIIALAMKEVGDKSAEPYNNLVYLALLGLLDPPRGEIKPAIELCHKAGIKIIMITGDNKYTATNIAERVGIAKNSPIAKNGDVLEGYEEFSDEKLKEIRDTTIFARVEPAQKLHLIKIHQDNDQVVAMTGDGVNDAPALKKADIGVAMGKRGTQVAKESADMILQDDNFSTIVKAVEQGRIIFDNIRSFIIYLLSCNLSEILVIFFASFFPIPLPILPLQILFLNVVTDIFPAFALGANRGESNIMLREPKSLKEGILTKIHWFNIVLFSLMMAFSVFGSFLIALFILGVGDSIAITIAFSTIGLAQAFFVFNMRKRDSSIIKNPITENIYIWGAIIICIALIFLAVYLPGLSNVLTTTDPGLTGWVVIFLMSLVPLAVDQFYIWIRKRGNF